MAIQMLSRWVEDLVLLQPGGVHVSGDKSFALLNWKAGSCFECTLPVCRERAAKSAWQLRSCESCSQVFKFEFIVLAGVGMGAGDF